MALAHPSESGERPRPVIISSGDLHNVGDLALLLQCAHGVRSRLPVKGVAVRQWAEPGEDIRAQLAAHDIAVLAGKDLLRSTADATGAVVMIGGGQMVRDNASLASLASLAAMMRWARMSGGEAAILGCGVDDLTSNSRRQLWADMFKGAGVVCVRDAASQAAAEHLSEQTGRPVVTADLVFTPSPLHQALRRQGGPPSIVIAPCADASERRGLPVEPLCRLALEAVDKLGVERVSLVAHDARPGMDPEICGQIAAALTAARPGLNVSIVASYVLAEVTAVYASAALVLTNRLHSVIFSLIAGRPVLILDDGTAKLRAAAQTFSIPLTPAAEPLARWPEVLATPIQRVRELEAAKARATKNFDLLAAAMARA